MPESIGSQIPEYVPLAPLRFHVSFAREPIDGHGGSAGSSEEQLCEGAFSEVTGLEASMEPRTIREGGANYGAHQRAGQVSFSTVVLKRGLTQVRDLWRWWALLSGAQDPALSGQPAGGAYAHRLTVRITLQDQAAAPVMTWRLERAMPVKFKTADFSARATEVGVEELHLMHEGLFFEEVR